MESKYEINLTCAKDLANGKLGLGISGKKFVIREITVDGIDVKTSQMGREIPVEKNRTVAIEFHHPESVDSFINVLTELRKRLVEGTTSHFNSRTIYTINLDDIDTLSLGC
jgi:dihydrodipicolinate reductase